MIHVGFTGTQVGMTSAQGLSVKNVLFGLQRSFWAHHGDCVGADAQFHVICRSFQLLCAGITGHIPDDDSKRAFCQFDSVMPARPYLVRNKDIVVVSDVMVATPRQVEEQFIGSGTWFTIRCTRRRSKPLALVLPSGEVQYERWPTQVRLPW